MAIGAATTISVPTMVLKSFHSGASAACRVLLFTRLVSTLQVDYHLFEWFFLDFSISVPYFGYEFRVSMLVPIGVISCSPGPEEPLCNPEEYEYQKDAAQRTKY